MRRRFERDDLRGDLHRRRAEERRQENHVVRMGPQHDYNRAIDPETWEPATRAEGDRGYEVRSREDRYGRRERDDYRRYPDRTGVEDRGGYEDRRSRHDRDEYSGGVRYGGPMTEGPDWEDIRDEWRESQRSGERGFGDDRRYDRGTDADRRYDRGVDMEYGRGYARRHERAGANEGREPLGRGLRYSGNSEYGDDDFSTGGGGSYGTRRQAGYPGGGRDYAAGSDVAVEGPHTGVGPVNYERSDRLRQEVCERLSQNGALDASNIHVSVEGDEVTLTGTVHDRFSKRLADKIVESVFGVHDVHNHLTIARDEAR